MMAAERLPDYLAAQKKLTRHVCVFVNGHFAAELSCIKELPAGVAVSTEDGLLLTVARECVVSEPIHLLFMQTTPQNLVVHSRNRIAAEKNSKVTIVEEHIAWQAKNYETHVVTEIHAAEDAQVHYVKLQNDDLSATHHAEIALHQQKNSCVKTHSFSRGSKWTRENLMAQQAAPGAESLLHGFYFLQHDSQHVEHHVHVNHAAQHGASTMLYKGILDNKSQAVFNGKVHVQPHAQHIQAHQANHNLLLSPRAEVSTKPELEIYADDVRCTHGATVGQLDTESLFYLRARGIAQHEAMHMLTRAFSEDVFATIEDETIRAYCKNRVKGHDEL